MQVSVIPFFETPVNITKEGTILLSENILAMPKDTFGCFNYRMNVGRMVQMVEPAQRCEFKP
jgi:hypothetical protein